MEKYLFESELENVTPNRSIIPAHSLTFAENALYVAEFIEVEHNKLFESIGINELAVYESTGMEIVYEGEQLQTIKAKIVKFFTNAWEAIKGAIEKVIKWFEEKKKEVRDKFANELIERATKASLEGVDPKKKFGTTHKYDIKVPDEACLRAFDFSRDVQSKFVDLAKSFKDEEKADQTAKIHDLKEDLMSKLIKEISGTDAGSIAEMSKQLKKEMLGEQVTADKEWVSKHLNDMVDVVEKGASTKTFKRQYNIVKQTINECIRETKKFKDEQSIIISPCVSVLKSTVQCSNSIVNLTADVLKRRYHEYSHILLSVSRLAAAKKEEKKATHESTVVASQIEMIESAFGW